MILRGAPVKFETTFVKQNRKLVPKCDFRVYWCALEHDEIFDQKREVEDLGARFEVSKLLFGMFRCAPRKSEATSSNQLSIMFYECGVRFYWPPRNMTPQLLLLRPLKN